MRPFDISISFKSHSRDLIIISETKLMYHTYLTIVLRQFQRLLISPVIPPSDRRRRRRILIGILYIDLLVLVLILIVAYPVRRSRSRAKSGSMLLVYRTGWSRESGRVVAHQLTDHTEGAGLPLRLLGCRFQPVDPLGSVEICVPSRGIGDNRAKGATFAAHAGDGATGCTLADFHSGRSGVRLLLRLRLRRWRWRRWWRAL